MILWIFAGIIVFVLIWVLGLRKWLRGKDWEWSCAFFASIEPIEIWLWCKSETVLWARLQAFGAVLLIVLPWAGALDVDPWLAGIPQQHHWWIKLVPVAALALNGLVTELLRRDTTKPLTLVAVPEFQPIPVEVKEAIRVSEMVKTEAVEIVKTAEAEGKV